MGNESAEHRQAIDELIREFLNYQNTEERNLATDQLLNAIYLLTQKPTPTESDKKVLLDRLFQSLGDI